MDSSLAHSANHLFGPPPFWSIFQQAGSAVARPETTLSEKVSCVLSSTTLRQGLNHEPVSSVPIQHVRRSSLDSDLSACSSGSSPPEPAKNAQFLQDSTAELANVLNGRRRTKEPPRLRPRSPTMGSAKEDSTVRPKSSSRGALSTLRASALYGGST